MAVMELEDDVTDLRLRAMCRRLLDDLEELGGFRFGRQYDQAIELIEATVKVAIDVHSE